MGNHSDDDDLPSWTDLGGDDDDDFPEFADTAVPSADTGSPDIGSETTDFAGLEGNPFVAAVLPQPSPRRRLYAAAGAAVVVVAIVVGLIVWLTTDSSSGSSAPKAASAATSAPSAPAPTPVAGACPSAARGAVYTGDTAGGVDSGPAVIMAFDYAYYVKRSGQAARDVVAADARVGTAAEIQSGIDKLALGTTHCLKITDRGDGLWGVELTQTPPGAAPVVIKQQIQTIDSGGRTWISSIVPDPQS